MTIRTRPADGTRRSALPHRAAMTLAATEYARVAAAMRALSPGDWDRPTDCPAWTVHQLLAHVVGMAAMIASPGEGVHQNREVGRRHREGARVDTLTAYQVERYGDRTPAELCDLMDRLGPRAARARRRIPAPIRALRVPGAEEVGGVPERWRVGYLTDTILTRDPWMHRIDLAHAVGADFGPDAGHDGAVVADVVAEWAGRHGAPCTLVLTGPAGGTWVFGDGDTPALELDAIEFCRVVSGRAPGTGLLATAVPF
ncbi:maleylpyruvate isomerase family mycothiol-dependent enzyme [Nocardia thailandica]